MTGSTVAFGPRHSNTAVLSNDELSKVVRMQRFKLRFLKPEATCCCLGPPFDSLFFKTSGLFTHATALPFGLLP